MTSPADVKAATWWLVRRFELDAMAARLDALAFDSAGEAGWRVALDGARRAVAGAVRHADARAARFVPDELERRALREALRTR